MPINKVITLTWRGEEYDVVMSMLLVDRIENKINLMQLADQCARGDVRYSHVANLLSIILNHAGAKTTQEKVFNGMFGGDGGDDGDDSNKKQVLASAVNILWEVLAAIFPEQHTKKKPAGEREEEEEGEN